MEDVKRYALLCSRDPVIIEAVEVSAAALEVELRVEGEAIAVKEAWAGAAVRLLGVELAARWGAPGRGEAHLVGVSAAELARCSAELGLPVLPLPEGQSRLAGVLAAAMRPQATSRTVAVLGASGGLGTSTLTAALAILAARAGKKAVAVDLARGSGGIDLLVGAETTDGLRWPGLAQARGELGDVFAALPEVVGARFLAQGRQGEPPPEPAVEAVLGALARSSDVIYLDAGRGPAPPQAERCLVLVGADVCSVAAAQRLGSVRAAGLVVRSGQGRRIPAAAVARSLSVDCAGALPHDKALPRLAELGLPPLPGPARRYARSVAAIAEWLDDA